MWIVKFLKKSLLYRILGCLSQKELKLELMLELINCISGTANCFIYKKTFLVTGNNQSMTVLGQWRPWRYQSTYMSLIINQNRKRGHVCRLKMTSGTSPAQIGQHRLTITCGVWKTVYCLQQISYQMWKRNRCM